jgi:hypothetical protein
MTRANQRVKEQDEQRRAKVAQPESRSLQTKAPRQTSDRPEILEAGNAALSNLLSEEGGGKPLPPETRTQMEQSFGVDFGDVRLHDDPNARAKAQSIGARAFTRGRDIYLGLTAPSLESDGSSKLLAHELAHVVQQDQASAVEKNAVSEPGDKFEQGAETAASRAVQGQAASVQSGGTAPGIQRDPDTVSRADVEAALTEFLQRAVQAQGGRTVHVTNEVRNAVMMLARAPDPRHRGPGPDPQSLTRVMRIELWLNGGTLPASPAAFAGAVAQRLPDPFDSATLQRLRRMPVRAPGASSVLGRAREVYERTEPGSAEREEEEAASRRAHGEPEPPGGSVRPRAVLPEQPSQEERMEQIAQIDRRQHGVDEPTVVGPVSVDLLRMRRVFGARREILHGTREPRPAPPAARDFPGLAQAIQSIAPDALTPAQARGTEAADSFAGAREVAEDLARRLDVAQQQRVESIELRLGENYHSVRDRAAMIAEVNRIIQIVRNALPHHASNVRYVDVYFGSRWVSRGQARSE